VGDISGSTIRRGFRLAGLPAAHAGRVALGLGRRLGGRGSEVIAAEVRARSAQQLFQVLGELKGGAMKVGQAMAAMEAAMPVELAGPYRDALTRLVESVPALPASVAQEALAASLGADWRDRFLEFDDRAAAAASLGQVHRATWHDGTEVAVKIRSPGIADALTADLRQLDRLAPLVRLGAAGVDPRALFAELGQRVIEELDYRREAATQRAFAEGFCGRPRRCRACGRRCCRWRARERMGRRVTPGGGDRPRPGAQPCGGAPGPAAAVESGAGRPDPW
jgi:predicted unusual protein kinase regulating ubiquinone biosynthesis (AarF/ABC1/UbiB family)